MATRVGIGALLLCAGLGAGALATAQADPPSTPASAQEREQMRAAAQFNGALADAIGRNGGARSLAMAAVFREVSLQGKAGLDDDTASDIAADARFAMWRKAADAKAGKDPIANPLLATLVPSPADQVHRNAANRWANAEPDNLAPLFFAGSDAVAMLAAGRTRHAFDVHWFDQIRAIAEVLGQHPELVGPEAAKDDAHMTVEQYSEGVATALVAAHALPAMGPLVDACRGRALLDAPARRADCSAIGATLRDHSDILIAQLIGNAIVRYGAVDPAARANADRFERRLRWQMEQDNATFGDPLKGPAAYHAMLQDPTLHGEHDAIERRLAAAHVPLDPPADWTPAH